MKKTELTDYRTDNQFFLIYLIEPNMNQKL